jgi:hypothetical protein
MTTETPPVYGAPPSPQNPAAPLYVPVNEYPMGAPYYVPVNEANPVGYVLPQQPYQIYPNPKYPLPVQGENPYIVTAEPETEPEPQEEVNGCVLFCLCVLSFFIPIIGLIMLCCLVQNRKKTARLCGCAALIGLLFQVVTSSFEGFD